jgi:hypothetical protein
MAAKMFPHLKLFCGLFMGPTLGFDTKQRNSFLIEFGVFYNKNNIVTFPAYSQLNMRKSHINEQFLVLSGPIISRFLHVQMREKIDQNNKVLSLWFIPRGQLCKLYLYDFVIIYVRNVKGLVVQDFLLVSHQYPKAEVFFTISHLHPSLIFPDRSSVV